MLPSKLLLAVTNQSVNIHGFLFYFNRGVMCEFPQNHYLVNWRNNKYAQVGKNCEISQKTINKNAIHLESLLELLEGDHECLILANQILGETTYFYTTRNIVKGLI